MGALLALVPLKDWIYCGIIVALLAGFGVYTHHERVVGADEALAPVAVLAQKAQLQIAVGTVKAADTEKENGDQFNAASSAPVADVPHIVCRQAAGSSDVSKASTGIAAAAYKPAVDSGSGPAFDPSGAILKRAAEADAQVTYLQQRVIELQTQMGSSP